MPVIDKSIMQIVKTFGEYTKSTSEKIKIVSAANGSCLCEFKVDDDHLNHLGALHGGFLAATADNVSSLTLLTQIYTHSTSISLNLSYLTPAFCGDGVIVDSKTVKVKDKIALVDIEMRNKATGDLLVKGMHTKIVLK